MSLRKEALSGMVWTFAQQFGTQIISFGVSIVLARLLLPAEFGLIGMLAIFIGIGNVLFEGGLTSSLIRSQNIDDNDYSTVFIFNLIGSIVIYGILYLTAPFIADFYKQPTLTLITRVYGITFILSAFGAVQNTILTKNLQFKKQVFLAIPSLIVGSITGLILAFNGYGVWALVYMALVNSFLTSLFLWISSNWFPQFSFDHEKFKYHFYYGYKLTLSAMLDIVFTNIYQIIIGRYYSSTKVGYYTRANTLMMLPVGNVSAVLNKVVFPLFSRVQEDLPRFKNAYKEIMQLVLFVITPIIVIMAILAKPLVVCLFTEKWLPIVPIFQIICITGILYPIHLYNLIVLQVKGRSDLFLKLEIAKKVLLSIILIISFFFGFYALLWGQLLFSFLALIINTHYAGKILNYSMLDQLKDIFPVFLFAIFMALVVYYTDLYFIDSTNIFRLFFGTVFGTFFYVFLAYIFKFQSINTISNLISKHEL